MNGIRDIYVDRGTSTIQVEYTGGDSALEQICDVVQRIGYEARIRETETVPSE